MFERPEVTFTLSKIISESREKTLGSQYLTRTTQNLICGFPKLYPNESKQNFSLSKSNFPNLKKEPEKAKPLTLPTPFLKFF
jgi:hypothetical protein